MGLLAPGDRTCCGCCCLPPLLLLLSGREGRIRFPLGLRLGELFLLLLLPFNGSCGRFRLLGRELLLLLLLLLLLPLLLPLALAADSPLLPPLVLLLLPPAREPLLV